MSLFTVLRLMPGFLMICFWVNPFFLNTDISKSVSISQCATPRTLR